MELTYLNKLKARKVALGEDEGDLAGDCRNADEKQWRDENKELFMALNESGDADKRSSLQDGEREGKLDVFREHGLNILQTVYSGAIEALPTSFSVRTRFLEILEAIDLAHSEDMRKKILNDMTRDFSKEPLYWDWLARVEIADLKGINAEQLSKAVQVLPFSFLSFSFSSIYYLNSIFSFLAYSLSVVALDSHLAYMPFVDLRGRFDVFTISCNGRALCKVPHGCSQ